MTTGTFTGNLDTPLDRIRSAIGDVNTTRVWLGDNEINAYNAAQPSEVWAAVRCCEAIIARVAAQVDFTNASLSKSAGMLIDNYTKLAARLTKLAGSSTSLTAAVPGALPRPRIGGLSRAGEDALRSDTDVPQPSFAEGGDDIRGGPSPEGDQAWWLDPLRTG